MDAHGVMIVALVLLEDTAWQKTEVRASLWRTELILWPMIITPSNVPLLISKSFSVQSVGWPGICFSAADTEEKSDSRFFPALKLLATGAFHSRDISELCHAHSVSCRNSFKCKVHHFLPRSWWPGRHQNAIWSGGSSLNVIVAIDCTDTAQEDEFVCIDCKHFTSVDV